MASVPPNLPNLWESLNRFQSIIGNVHASLTNPVQKQALGELLGKLQEARAEAEKVVPDVVSGMQKKNEEIKAWAEDFQAQLAQKQRELEERRKAAAEQPTAPAAAPERPAPPAVQPVELVEGLSLQQEMLKELGLAAPPPRSPKETHREIWEDWDLE